MSKNCLAFCCPSSALWQQSQSQRECSRDSQGHRGLGDILRTVESLGRSLDLLQLLAREHPLEDDERLQHPEVDLTRVRRGAMLQCLGEDRNRGQRTATSLQGRDPTSPASRGHRAGAMTWIWE